MISGLALDPVFRRMVNKVKCLYEWNEWERHEFDQGFCRIRQATDNSINVDQETNARKMGLITMSAHRRKHVSETLSQDEHTCAQSVCNTIHDAGAGTFESHRHVQNNHKSKFHRVEPTCATGAYRSV